MFENFGSLLKGIQGSDSEDITTSNSPSTSSSVKEITNSNPTADHEPTTAQYGYFESVQEPIIGSSRKVHNNRNNCRHDRKNSNSSAKYLHNDRDAMIMISPPLPSRNYSLREKQRRRSRNSSLRSSIRSCSSSCDSPISRSRQLEDDKLFVHSGRSPIAVRRRSSKQPGSVSSHRRSSSNHTKNLPSDNSRNYYDNGVNLNYSSPEFSSFSSESSPDSSPSRLVADMHRLQQQQILSHERRSSCRLSVSRQGCCDSPQSSFIGSSIYGSPSSNAASSANTNTSQLAIKLNSIKTTMPSPSIKSLCLSGTFISMVILSLSGMIFLTNRAVFPVIDLDQLEKEQSIPAVHNRSNKTYSAAGLRGKMILGGRMWSDDISPSNNNAPLAIYNKIGSKEKKVVQKPISSSAENDKTSKQRHGRSKKKKIKMTVPSHRLQIRIPPKISHLKSKFEVIDPHLYHASAKVVQRQQDATSISFYPRILSVDPSVKRVTRKIKGYAADFTDNTQLYGTLPSDDERLSMMELKAPYSEGECVPMQEWQTTYHPTCNAMHEQALQTIGATESNYYNYKEDSGSNLLNRREPNGLIANLFGTGGFWRYAWKLVLPKFDSIRDKTDTVVLKTLKYEHNFEDAHFEHDRVDAVAMERLTSSPHVINIFSFCGHSVVSEYADGSRLGALADKSKKMPLERIRIARDIANGLADVHGIDGDGNTTFVHLDINPANVVSVNGTLKLNDFNIGIIRQWNTTSNEACGFPAQFANPQWRSPEEARDEQHLTEKVDIFSLGHIFFRLICGHEPWNKLEPGGRPNKKEVNEKVQRGVLPFIPYHVRDSIDPEVIAIRDVMLECYNIDPAERPRARDIAKALDRIFKELTLT